MHALSGPDTMNLPPTHQMEAGGRGGRSQPGLMLQRDDGRFKLTRFHVFYMWECGELTLYFYQSSEGYTKTPPKVMGSFQLSCCSWLLLLWLPDSPLLTEPRVRYPRDQKTPLGELRQRPQKSVEIPTVLSRSNPGALTRYHVPTPWQEEKQERKCTHEYQRHVH